MSNKEIVETVIQAFLDNDLEKALPHMAEDIQMAWPGYFALKPGKEALIEFFASIPETLESGTEDLISEGDKVIGTGYVISRHDDGEIRKSLFADVYYLENKKIKLIKSYMVFDHSEQE